MAGLGCQQFFVLYRGMALSFSLVKEGVSLGLEAVQHRVRDLFEVSANTEVVFKCLNRGITIHAVLSGQLNLSASSKWTGYFQGLPQLLNILDGGNQIFFGHSLQQPWMGRKYWSGTEPMVIRLPLQFVSDTNAKKEVYDPAVMLLSLLFPRIANDAEMTNKMKLWGEYVVPGPSIFYNRNGNKDDSVMWDYVSVRLGEMLDFTACYLESVTLNVENSFDTKGYPHCIKADVSFRAMDSMFVPADASFVRLSDFSMESPDMLERLTDGARDLAHSAKSFTNEFFKKAATKANEAITNALGSKP